MSSSGTKSSARSTTKRLIQELQNYHQDPNPVLLHLGPVSDDELMKWTAVLEGVEGTAYEGMYPLLPSLVPLNTLPLRSKPTRHHVLTGGAGGRWLLKIEIPPTYPLTPPTITFTTPICHPNIHFRTGEICLDLLKSSWSPAYTISSTLTAVHQLLTSAEPDSPLNIDVALLAREGDWLGMESLVRFYTGIYKYDGEVS
jgi:peroxin-4